MRPHTPRRPLTTRTAAMPAFERQGGLTERRERFSWVEQVCIVTVLSTQVLAPELEPQVASILSGAIPKTTRIDGFPAIALLVKHRTGDLGIMAP